MIKTITGSRWVTVTNGGSSSYINNHASAQGVGNMRYNVINQNFEVWDGTMWVTLNMSHPSVELTSEAHELLEWARAQRTMQMNRLTLAQNNPALLKALEAIKRAEENFELLEKFVEHDQIPTA